MKLLKLRLHNFKGCKEFTLEINGNNCTVYGANGTYKTTLYDAFTWLLNGKDSLNRKDFSLKTLDSDNNALPGLDHEVEALFEIDGKQVTLKKVFKEKYTKKRGAVGKDFSGHTTDHSLAGVPVKEKEYNDYVASIASEDIFKMLTNPLFFSETMDWKKRRQVLIDVCGDVSDDDVIASDKALAGLPDILKGRAIDDHRKVVAARRTEINKALEAIPVRIDEASRALPDVTGLNAAKIATDLAGKRADLQGKQQELADIQNGGEVSKKRRHLAELDAEILWLKNEGATTGQKAVSEKRKSLNDTLEFILKHESIVHGHQYTITNNNREINNLKEQCDTLREGWHVESKTEFWYEQSDTCPTCGQQIPEEQLSDTRQKALEIFNLKKVEKLELITAKGKALTDKISSLQTEIKDLEQRIAALQTEINKAKERETSLNTEINNLQKETPENPHIIVLENEKKIINEEIAALLTGDQDAIAAAKDALETLNIAILELEQQQLKFKSRKDGEARIEELKQQERTLAAEYERLEGELYLLDLFVKAKVNLLEGRINSKFKIARFKLFIQQINGGIEPCCEVLGNGVPFNSGLNAGARIQTGLDIIRTLCDHYNFYPPIWIDNRESVIEIPEMKNQLIDLYVSAEDKALRVEVSENKLREAI